MKMENRDAFVTTRSFCLAFLGIAVSLTIFGECTVSSSKTTTTQDVVTLPPKRCSFNNIDYNVGQSWNPFLLPAGYWRCIRCSCKLTSDGSTATIDCKSCRGTANEQHPEEGQRICTHKGKIRKHGAVWAETISDRLRNDQCTECSCTDRFVSCAVRTCPALSCKGKVKGSKTCCPVCKGDSQATRDARDCFTMGRSYRHLENWFHFGPPRYDLCIICSCKNSSVGCRKVACPTPPCDNPERKPGACCNTCPVPVSNTGKLQRNNGSTSETVQTKNVSDECERAGVKFPHNTTFNPTIGPFGVSFCVTCLCNVS
ncbi:PREDICTED: chordin-like protein 1 [Acropora digitifera]|uniref:chordin-like protein 1 n=1 Tax=Acropora digitifera TaxID=70779 RepID=UPI00077A3309|nr:PREDICTED: chordin-like protein 1 [Acropora digitifera]